MLHLNQEESLLFEARGWIMRKTSDGPEFDLYMENYSITIGPVIKRKLSPMVFYPQTQVYDDQFSEISRVVGWGGDRGLSIGSPPHYEGLSSFKIESLDQEFVDNLTMKLMRWIKRTDFCEYVQARLDRRQRNEIYLRDIIDLTYLGHCEELLRLRHNFVNGVDDFLHLSNEGDDLERLDRAIELACPSALDS